MGLCKGNGLYDCPKCSDSSILQVWSKNLMAWRLDLEREKKVVVRWFHILSSIKIGIKHVFVYCGFV